MKPFSKVETTVIERYVVLLIFGDGPTVRLRVEIVSSDPAVQRRYEDMRLAGESHSIAEMLATRSFPHCVC